MRAWKLLALLCSFGCSAPRDTEDPNAALHPPVQGGGGAGPVATAGVGNVAGSSQTGAGGSLSASAGTGGALAAAGGKAPMAGAAGAPPMPPSGNCDFAYDKLVDVSSAADLARALSSASAGSMIRLPDTEIRGAFKATTSGSADKPIVLCGSRAAVLSASDTSTVLTLEGDYWVLSGFSVTGGQKGVLLDGAQHDLLTLLSVHGTGNEAVHFRSGSSDNVLEWSEISDTGNASPEFGEGVYIGSAISQWAKFTGSATTPDRADRNIVRNNKLGPNVRAELIDVKEGTTGGLIQDNSFDGAGIASGGFADSWVDVKGNAYSIVGNQGSNAATDGFQVHVVDSGWGNDNVFQKNHADVNAKGYGFRVSDSAKGTVVGCDNVVSGAGAGLSNIGCKN